MTEKEYYAENMRRQATLAIQAMENGYAACLAYTARGYAAGENVLTDEDITSQGVTALDIANTKYFFENLYKLINNLSPDHANFADTLYIMRNDLK